MTTTLPEPPPPGPAPEPGIRRKRWQAPVFRSGHLLVANSALTAASGFAYWLVIARLYPTEDVGRNLAAISALLLLGGVAQANIMTALLRFVPYTGAASRRVVARGFALATVLTTVAGAVFVLGLGIWSEDLRFLRDDPRLAIWFIVSVAVWALFSIQDHVLTAVRRTGVVPVENLAFSALKLVLAVAFAAALPATGILLSWTVAAAAAVVVTSGYIFFRALPAHMAERPVADPPALRVMGRFLALDYVASLFLFAAVSGLPLIILDRTGPTTTAGFLVAWTIVYALYLVPLAMGQSLVAHSADPGADLDRDYRALLAHTMMLVAPAALVAVAFAPQILALFGADYVAHDTTLRLLALSAIPNVLVDLTVSAAQVRQRMRVVLATRAAQSLGVFALGLYLLDRHGIVGVAAAWLIAQTAVAAVIGTHRLCCRRTVVRLPRQRHRHGVTLSSVGPAPSTGDRPPPAQPTPKDGRPVTVSVVICCYTDRRWDQLVAAVQSLQEQTQRPDEVIVVVDHNPALLERARRGFPQATVVPSTGAKGLSGARNTGVATALSDVVAFLDDDAMAGPGWVAEQAAAYADPTVVGTAATVEPIWMGGRPRWFPEEFAWVVGCSYRGLPTEPVEVRNAIGAGMSLRRNAVVRAGGFDEGLGRVDTDPVGCEETELCLRLRAAGGRILLVPNALTRHHVAPERGTWRYFLARCWAEGRSKARVRSRAGTDALETERSYLTRTLPRGFLTALADWMPARAIALALGTTATVLGYLAGRAARVGGLLRFVPATLPLAAGLGTWFASLRTVDPGAMSDLGLVSVLPPAWFAALALLLVLLGLHIARRSSNALVGAHLVAVLAILHATPTLVYDQPRYSWTYKHIGVTDYISRHGSIDTADPTLGVYHSWPGFFTAASFLSETTGIAVADMARWSPPIFQLLLLIPALVAFRCLTDDARRVWLGLSIFALGNWVGQDYFAPQPMAFLLYLTVIALVLRWLPAAGLHRRALARLRAVHDPAPVLRDAPSATSRRRGLAAVLVVLMAALVGTHQLTPFLLLSALVALAAVRHGAPRWAPLALLAMTALWLSTFGRDYLLEHASGVLATLGRPDSNAASNLAAATLPEQQVVMWAGRALVLAIGLLAVLATMRDPRGGRRRTTWLLALAPAPLLLSSYDGEIIFRVYLFALPWLALLAAGTVFGPGRVRWLGMRTTALLLALAVPFTLAYYGKERANHYDAHERAANDWVLENAEPGSVLVGAALDFPFKDRAYERYSYRWLSQLAPQAREELALDPVPVLIDTMGATEAFTGYVLLSDSQDPAIAYGSDLPQDIQATVADALIEAPEFTVVYTNPGAVVFRLEFTPREELR